MDEVIKHPWVSSGGYEIEDVPKMEHAVQVCTLNNVISLVKFVLCRRCHFKVVVK